MSENSTFGLSEVIGMERPQRVGKRYAYCTRCKMQIDSREYICQACEVELRIESVGELAERRRYMETRTTRVSITREILTILSEGPASASQIAEAVGCVKATVYYQIKALVKAERAVFEPGAGRSSGLLMITDEGREYLNR